MDYLVCKELYHHGIKGQKWGIRKYQNEDGTLTSEGKKRYGVSEKGVITDKYKLMNYKSDVRETISRNHKEYNDYINYNNKFYDAIKKYDKTERYKWSHYNDNELKEMGLDRNKIIELHKKADQITDQIEKEVENKLSTDILYQQSVKAIKNNEKTVGRKTTAKILAIGGAINVASIGTALAIAKMRGN